MDSMRKKQRVFVQALGRTGQRRHAVAAYTLAEVLVASVILAIIAAAFYAALSSGFNLVESTRQDLRATQVVMQKMEGIRLCTWSQLTNFTFNERYDPLSSGGGAGVLYTGTVTVGQATNLPVGIGYSNDVRLVTVSVNWTN